MGQAERLGVAVVPTDDLPKGIWTNYHEQPDGSLRILLQIDDHLFALSPAQAEELEGMLHRETQKACSQVASELDRFDRAND